MRTGTILKRHFKATAMECYGFYDEILKSNHILIAGKTGSGKSVLLNDLLFNILSASPIEAQFVLIDPKRVELSWYKKVVHCLGYASEMHDIIRLLDDIIYTMERRYKEMERKHERLFSESPLYVIIDELADLMMSNKKDIMPRLQKIAQLGRAAKVFLIAATQSPSRVTIPAALTLNFTCRIALQCFSAIESRQIIGVDGAEQLPQYGICIVKNEKGLTKVEVPYTPENKLQERIRYWETHRGRIALF